LKKVTETILFAHAMARGKGISDDHHSVRGWVGGTWEIQMKDAVADVMELWIRPRPVIQFADDIRASRGWKI
jgi:hypothetical protein